MNTNCELCSATTELRTYEVAQSSDIAQPNTATLCATCIGQIEDPSTIPANRWHCLNESIWTDNPAVKVLAWRILNKISTETWAQDLLEQLYMEEDLLAWAQEGSSGSQSAADQGPVTRDSNGTALSAGDSVTLIKDLEVKGAGFTAKRGTLVKNITLTENPEHIEGRVNGTTIVLKTMFLKKA